MWRRYAYAALPVALLTAAAQEWVVDVPMDQGMRRAERVVAAFAETLMADALEL